jgi:hypothetical protein
MASLRGRVQRSVEILRDLIPRARTKFAAASLQRDIVAFCATGFFWQCSLEAHRALYSAITADRDLSPLFPDMMLYLLRERIWSDNRYCRHTRRATSTTRASFAFSTSSVTATCSAALVEKPHCGLSPSCSSLM